MNWVPKYPKEIDLLKDIGVDRIKLKINPKYRF
jgi:hypothetical protein